MKFIFSLSVLFLSLTLCYSQDAPKFSNEFLSIGVGARAHGMSGAVISSVDDVSSAIWNPSRLPYIQGERQLFLMHAEYFAGIAKYDYGALGIRLDSNSALSFSAVRMGVDNIPNTIDLIDNQGNIDFDKITSFSLTDFAGFISYGSKLHNSLSFGGSAKIIRRKMGDFASAWGFGIDLSASYPYKDWLFSSVIKDATSTFNAWSYTFSDRMKEVFSITGNIIPENSLELTLPQLTTGAARKIFISSSIYLMAELDANLTFDGRRNVLLQSKSISVDPKFGLEIALYKTIYLRTGISNFQKETVSDGEQKMTFQPNIGIGIKVRDFLSVDYALTDIGNNSVALYSNIFSIRLSFNKHQEQK